MLTARKFNAELDYEIVNKWGKEKGFPMPPKDCLSDIGFMVGESACGFLYVTNSKIGWVEWVFSNPWEPEDKRVECIDMLFKLTEMTARELGLKVLFSSSGIPHYSGVLKRNGFEVTDQKVDFFIKVLKGS